LKRPGNSRKLMAWIRPASWMRRPFSNWAWALKPRALRRPCLLWALPPCKTRHPLSRYAVSS